MKRITLFSLLLGVLAWNIAIAQTTYVANSNPGAPTGTNVFTGASALQDAIDAAISGDIIHVVPSEVDYGDALIDDKSLTIIGVGLNPSSEIGLRSLVDEIRLDNSGASGSRISGLVVDDVYLAWDNTSAHTISNILVENCEIHRLVGAGSGNSTSNSLSGLIVRNCVFNSSNNTSDPKALELTNAAGVIIENNIIRGECCTSGSVRAVGATIRNNLFYDGLGTGISFVNIEDCVIQDNIFLNTTPNSWANTGSGNTFNNNISYNTSTDAFPTDINENGGTGNIEATDPMLTNVPLSPGGDPDWSYDYDLTPMGGSPVLNAGTDGTDIGPTGGANPFNAEGTFLPVIQALNLPAVVSQGDDLQVNIKAKGSITND